MEKKGATWVRVLIVVGIFIVVLGIAFRLYISGIGGLPCGMKIETPDGWKMQTVFNSVIYTFPDEDAFSPHISIDVKDVIGLGDDLDGYTEYALGRLDGEDNEEILISEESFIDGHDAYKIVYTWDLRGERMKDMKIWTVVGNSVYVISYLAYEGKYDMYPDVAEEIISNLKIAGDCYE